MCDGLYIRAVGREQKYRCKTGIHGSDCECCDISEKFHVRCLSFAGIEQIFLFFSRQIFVSRFLQLVQDAVYFV